LALPISARAIGEFTDIFPLCALASGSPTIRHSHALVQLILKSRVTGGGHGKLGHRLLLSAG
jgi:hypothetical protein